MEIIFFKNEYYTSEENERHQYDLAFPKNASGDMGLVLCIHGGAWEEGRKDSYTNVLFQVCEEKGVAAACINYRYVSEKVTFDGVLDDISSSLSAIKEKGQQYGINFNRVLLTGISAGGHLSLLYAYARKDTAPIKPACVVELCGPNDFENQLYYSADNSIDIDHGAGHLRNIISNGIGFKIDMNDFDAARTAIKKYSPINYVDSQTVPTVFGHGEFDRIVPYQNAIDLDEKLTKYNIEHTFISFPNSGHGCEDKKSMSELMKLFFEYIDKYLK